jgi:hypothetical protein
MVDIAETIMGWLLRVFFIFLWGACTEVMLYFVLYVIGAFIWFVLDVDGDDYQGLGDFFGRWFDRVKLRGFWIQTVNYICILALGCISSYLPTYIISTDRMVGGQFAYRWFLFSIPGSEYSVVYWLIALEVTGLIAVAGILIFIGGCAGIDDKVERYRQRRKEERRRKEHTTCKGCRYLQNEGECHNFAHYLAEGEMRPCYRKRPWREKRGKP